MRVEAQRCDGWIASRIDQTPHCLTRQASKGAPGPLEGPAALSRGPPGPSDPRQGSY